MRLFPADFVPNLSVAPPEMLGAWVMPWYLPRRHKDRLWSLLVRGLHRFDDRLHFIELHWAERQHVEDGRLRLPRPVVVRLRGQPLSSAEPATIVEFANKWLRGTPVFDFEELSDWQSFGWLGPFKVRVLHCVMDVLLDRPPIADTQPIVDTLQEAARLLLTPIELLDFAELMLERIAFGVSTESARAMAFGDAFAARFELIYSADTMARVLGEATRNELSDPIKRALVRVGLVDGSTRLPLLDLVHDPEIRQRAMEAFSRRMGEVRWVDEPLEEKAPAPARVMDEPVKEIELPPANAAIASPIVRDALARILDDQIEAGTKLLVDAWRDGAAESFSKEDALIAGKALAKIAYKLNRSAFRDYGGTADRAAQTRIVTLCELAAAYFIKGGGGDESLEWLILGGRVASEMNEPAIALRLLERAEGLMHENANVHTRAELCQGLGIARWILGKTDAAIHDLSAAAVLYAAGKDYRDEARGRLLLAVRLFENLMLDDAEVEIAKVFTLYQQLTDAYALEWGYANQLRGIVLARKGEFDRVDACFQKAFDVYDVLNDADKISNITACIGHLRLLRGDDSGAKSAFEASGQIGLQGLGDIAMIEGNFGDARDAYMKALDAARSRSNDTRNTEAGILRAIARLKFIVNEPFADDLQAAEELAAQTHALYGAWASKSLRAAISPPEEALPLLTECADFFESKGMPWETCILRAIIALFHGETAEQIQALLQPMLGGTRAEVIAALVKANRTKDAHHALLIQLPTG